MTKLSTIMLALSFAGTVYAADVATEFSAANKLYAEGKFAGAATGYHKILEAGGASPALYFNSGNAEFKLGQLGGAIAAYRQAALLWPRGAEIRANLDFVRNQVQGPTTHENRWQGWLGTLTLNEWTVLVAVAFWLTFALLATKQIRPVWQNKLRGLTVTVAAITILSGAVLGWQAANHFSKPTAVVVAGKVTARSGPFDDAQSAFTASDGAELSVLSRHTDWVQVAAGAGKSGWLQAKQVEVLPGT